MSEAVLQVLGTDLIVLETIAETAGVDVETFIGQSIALGLNLADLVLESEEGMDILFDQPDDSYTRYTIDFSPTQKPTPAPEMAAFERDLDTRPPLPLVLPHLVQLKLETAADAMTTDRRSFLEAAVFFRYQWLLTRQHQGKIRMEDIGDTEEGLWVVENDESMFSYQAGYSS